MGIEDEHGAAAMNAISDASAPGRTVPGRLQKLESLQAGRGLAALFVLFSHVIPAIWVIYPATDGTANPFGLGRLGVDFFFVLSGFLMVWVHAADFGQPMRLKSYCLKRLSRIYPVYWALCLVLVPTTLFIPALREHQGMTGSSMVASIFLLPHAGPRLLGVTWTLEYELLFYVSFAIFFFSARIGVAVCSLWCVAIVAAAFWEPNLVSPTGAPALTNPVASFLLSLHVIEFFIGMSIAWFARRGYRMRRPGWLLAAGALIAAGLIASTYIGNGKALFAYKGGRPAIAIGEVLATLIVMGTVHLELQRPMTLPRPLRLLGAASYSVYLIHFLAIAVFIVWAKHSHKLGLVPLPVMFALIAIFALVPGLLLHLWVERPLLAFTSARIRPRRTAPNPALEA